VLKTHLADLVKRVLAISSSVFEVVMSWERPVNVPGDRTVLRRLLEGREARGENSYVKKGRHREKESGVHDISFILDLTEKKNSKETQQWSVFNSIQRSGAGRITGGTECSLLPYKLSTATCPSNKSSFQL